MNLQPCWTKRPQSKLFMIWDDQRGEDAYHVSGYVDYWPDRCATSPATEGAMLEFSQDLAANTTFFEMPRRPEGGAVFAKEYEFTIQAVDVGGAMIASDGSSTTVDSFGC